MLAATPLTIVLRILLTVADYLLLKYQGLEIDDGCKEGGCGVVVHIQVDSRANRALLSEPILRSGLRLPPCSPHIINNFVIALSREREVRSSTPALARYKCQCLCFFIHCIQFMFIYSLHPTIRAVPVVNN